MGKHYRDNGSGTTERLPVYATAHTSVSCPVLRHFFSVPFFSSIQGFMIFWNFYLTINNTAKFIEYWKVLPKRRGGGGGGRGRGSTYRTMGTFQHAILFKYQYIGRFTLYTKRQISCTTHFIVLLSSFQGFMIFWNFDFIINRITIPNRFDATGSIVFLLVSGPRQANLCLRAFRHYKF